MAWVLALLLAIAPAAIRLVHPAPQPQTTAVRATIGPAPTDSPHALVQAR